MSDVDVYTLCNVPVKVLGTVNRTFSFGWVETTDEATMTNVEGETASYSDDALGSGSVDGTTSSGGIHSTQVKAALLSSWDGQHMHYSQRVRDKNLPHCIVWAAHPTLNLSH